MTALPHPRCCWQWCRQAVLVLIVLTASFARAEGSAWSDRETRLANEYLSLLVEQPEYGRIVDLLWQLYLSHGETALLLRTLQSQADQTRHPSVQLVLAHVLRRSGDRDGALALYNTVLVDHPAHSVALRGAADLLRAKDPEAAADRLNRLAETMPSGSQLRAAVWLELGDLRFALDDVDAAAMHWEQAAAELPQDLTQARVAAQRFLQAGLSDRAATFFRKLADEASPAQRMEALLDLARLREHAGQFEEADAALRDAVALLHYRDPRHTRVFERRVRLHERFGQLDALESELAVALEGAGNQRESVLLQQVSLAELTVDLEARLAALQQLVNLHPEGNRYRWPWIRALMDHGDLELAASELDRTLEATAPPVPITLILLRAEVDLRRSETEAATARLQAWIDQSQLPQEAEEELLTFAQQRTLDAVVERLLTRRVSLDPSNAEAVFSLAAHHRKRIQDPAMKGVLDTYVEGSPNAAERRRRLAETASFLAGGSDLDAAIVLAREAVQLSNAGRDEHLQLADLLIETGRMEEAREWVEKAWTSSTTDAERLDADERLLPILLGTAAAAELQPAPSVEFQLPSIFTGAGFGEDPPEDSQQAPEAVRRQAEQLVKALASGEDDPARVFRAAWWSLRARDFEGSYRLLRKLAFDPHSGAARELTVEQETLLLELAREDGNLALVGRTLKRLIEKDPANQLSYTLRLVEWQLDAEQQSHVAGPGESSGDAASRFGIASVALLQDALRQAPDNEQLLSALSRIYLLQRRQDEALALWESTIQAKPEGPTRAPLLRRYADLLLQLQQLPRFVDAHLEILAVETDLERRRDSFKRFLDRLMWSDTGDLSDTVLQDRLHLVRQALEAAANRHPFDSFYSEALARIHTRLGEASAAFTAMKQAYYTAPDAPFSLDQLRDAALQVADIDAAIYFQRQVVAASPPKTLGTESRRLIELLEQAFRIEDADRVRRQLEQRFSQDVPALADLAEHYAETAQEEARRRVLEQIVRVRPWAARARLDLALTCIDLGDTEAAIVSLAELVRSTSEAKDERGAKGLQHERLPLPLTDLRSGGKSGNASDLSELMDIASGLPPDSVERLRTFFSFPREEWARLPDSPAMVRLRAVEEWARLMAKADPQIRLQWLNEHSDGTAPRFDPVESLWASYYSQQWERFGDELEHLLGKPAQMDLQFARIWLLLRTHQLPRVLDGLASVPEAQRGSARGLLQTAINMLIDLDAHTFLESEMTLLGEAQLYPNTVLLGFVRRLEDRGRYPAALALGEWLRVNSRTLGTDYALALARMAEAAEQWDLARRYLEKVVTAPTRPGRYQGVYDPVLFGIGAYVRTSPSPTRTAETLQSVWQELQRTVGSDLTTLRRAAVAGLAGAGAQAATHIDRWVQQDLIANRSVGRLPGSLSPQGSLRFDEAPQAQSLWEEAREVQAMLNQQGLATVTAAVERAMLDRWGGLQLGPRPGYEFNEARLRDLVWQLQQTDHPNRLRLIRQWLAPVDMNSEASVELLSELGTQLETAQLSREAIEVYRRLPERAPTNSEYVLWLLRSSETAREIEPGRSFSLQIIEAVPPYRPPTPSNEQLREMHAHFIRMAGDVDELRERGMTAVITPTLSGRQPPETPYLRQLALELEERGQDREAAKAWQRFHECHNQHPDDGIVADSADLLQQAKLLVRLRHTDEARALLRSFTCSDSPTESEQELLILHARLAAKADDWATVRSIMTLAVARQSPRVTLGIAELLNRMGHQTEGLNLLIQADRRSQLDTDRFELRFGRLRFHRESNEPLSQSLARLFRTPTRAPLVLRAWMDWLKTQAAGPEPQRQEWITALRQQALSGVDRPLAALSLAAFGEYLTDADGAVIVQAWDQAASDDDRHCVELAAESLLAANRAELAEAVLARLADIPSLRQQSRDVPLLLRTAHARGDEHRLHELFAQIIHMPFPGGTRTTEWADALRQTGHVELAHQLMGAALDRARATGILRADLLLYHARFLIDQNRHSEAESFLLRHDYALTAELDTLIYDLYAASDRLAHLPKELPRLGLASGIEAAILRKLSGGAESAAAVAR